MSPEDIRKRRRFWRVSGVLGLALILAAALTTQPKRIQNSIATESRSVLQSRGMTTVSVEADGRDLRLNGTVANRNKLAETLEATVSVPGVRTLTHQLSIASESEPLENTLTLVSETPLSNDLETEVSAPVSAPQLSVSRSNDKTVVSGRLADPAQLAAVLKDLETSGPVENTLLQDDSIANTPWLEHIDQILVILPVISDASLDITEDRLTLNGTVESASARDSIAERLDNLAAAGLSVNNTIALKAIETVEPTPKVLENPSIVISREGENLILSGALPDWESAQSLLYMLTSHFNSNRIDNRLSVSADVGPATWLSTLAPLFPGLRELDSAGISVQDGMLSLTGTAPDAQSAARLQLAAEALADTLVIRNGIKIEEKLEPAPQKESFGQALQTIDLKNILFESNSAEFNPDSLDILNQLVALLKQYADIPIEVAGHTDATGDEGWNQQLSQLRANAVRDFLISQDIDGEQITAIGYGESRPVTSNSTRAGRAQNRRIEINPQHLTDTLQETRP